VTEELCADTDSSLGQC